MTKEMTEMQLKKLIEKKAETKNPKEEIRRYEGRLKERLEKQEAERAVRRVEKTYRLLEKAAESDENYNGMIDEILEANGT